MHVLAALAEMQPVSSFKPNREVSINFKKLAGSLIGEKYKPRRFMSRAKEAIKEFTNFKQGEKYE